ncbi:glucose-1-phosphate cytidylyltransferase [Candidatus Kuenenia stuttgartiensis]|uniref:Glucose-1-phosphate cytidylyltransferase n=2 Tax=Kuenenia stuttgartiensis TaxID=174633 RepID=A0A6G7GUG8_KUEST|nr:glucose-1-phosphate cytidylyltransferase [Candidatus Kuenenia stuttgartiensis]QII12857.1 glucose-1-phosphate cytidylyltransferase [Candidatus Kuenenia stuttgartiensis]
MKAVILAGGFGTRLSEETVSRPKPMIEIGGKPILWHIMNIYGVYGINEFIIAAGYKAEVIKEYFLDFYAINNDITVDLNTGNTTIHNNGNQPKWKIHIVDTGLYTQTGGRLKRLKGWLEKEETFLFTYGDGVADIDINTLLKFHKAHNKLVTVTGVHTPERFGRIAFEGDQITSFHEKPEHAEGWINGGYCVLNSKVFDYIENDETIWERSPMERLASEGQLFGYRHSGFWSCMDTLKEKNFLEELWNSGKAPWKVW